MWLPTSLLKEKKNEKDRQRRSWDNNRLKQNMRVLFSIESELKHLPLSSLFYVCF